jgi:hypothetical protein
MSARLQEREDEHELEVQTHPTEINQLLAEEWTAGEMLANTVSE